MNHQQHGYHHELRQLAEVVATTDITINQVGRVVNVLGLVVEVAGLTQAMGETCRIMKSDSTYVTAEVIGFHHDRMIVMPYDAIMGIANGMLVMPIKHSGLVAIGQSLLGRVVNEEGQPIDGKGNAKISELMPLYSTPLNPLLRARISRPLDVGVKAINGLITLCIGQRIGIFAESGMGKSYLLGMMTEFTNADVVIVGLIGERSREVKEFIEEILGDSGLAKSIVVAVPADHSPLKKVKGALYATAAAEYFRDQGKQVLLIIDSMTRFAQAHREISLSAGELPATKGYTPSVFAKLSQIIERSGNGAVNSGSITAIYTVLTEGEHVNDPVAEHIRSLIDGHIILSKALAESGHYPAIDVEKSISRTMNAVVDKEQLAAALLFKKLVSAYQRNKDMINIGMYQPGRDREVDAAIKFWPALVEYLQQNRLEQVDYTQSLQSLTELYHSMKVNL